MPHSTPGESRVMTWQDIRRCNLCGCPVFLGPLPGGGTGDVTPVCGAMHLCGENCACRFKQEDETAL